MTIDRYKITGSIYTVTKCIGVILKFTLIALGFVVKCLLIFMALFFISFIFSNSSRKW